MSRLLLPLVLVALVAGGCGTSDDRDQARATVERFYDAIRHDDADAACDELGQSLLEQVESQTQQSCRGVITRFDYEGGSIERAQVFITNAKVDLDSGESAFLSRESDGWKLSAIACKALEGKPSDRPFECEAEA
jgi:hypothetical protein